MSEEQVQHQAVVPTPRPVGVVEKAARSSYFAIVINPEGTVEIIEADNQSQLKEKLAGPNVREIVKVIRGKKLEIREQRSIVFLT